LRSAIALVLDCANGYQEEDQEQIGEDEKTLCEKEHTEEAAKEETRSEIGVEEAGPQKSKKEEWPAEDRREEDRREEEAPRDQEEGLEPTVKRKLRAIPTGYASIKFGRAVGRSAGFVSPPKC